MLWIFQVKLVVGILALGGIVTVFALLPTNDYLVAYAEWSKDKQVRGGLYYQEELEREKERDLNIGTDGCVCIYICILGLGKTGHGD